RALEPVREPMTEDTLFDAASLTKVLATTPSVMRLVEQGRLDLESPVARHLPGFAAHGKGDIRIRHLLTHTSGLRPGLSLAGGWEGWEEAIRRACDEKPTQPPDTRFVYSDINFIVLGELVRTVSGRELDAFARDEVFRPAGMRDTGYRRGGSGGDVARVAPTERQGDGTVLRGVVHDPTARRMGGVAGHAGVFTTAADVARFSRMLLHGGRAEGRRVFQPSTVARMTRAQTPAGVPARGLGWDIDSPYAGPRGRHFPVGSYGHTGWTGTSMWIDPASGTAVIFLSNRNHPTEDGDVRELRRQLGTLAAEALPGWKPSHPVTALEPPGNTGAPGGLATPAVEARVEGNAGPADGPGGAADRPEPAGALNGIDVLVRDGFAPLRGRRVGLVTNHTGHDRERRATIDLLFQAPGVQVVALFSPEHGIRGALDEQVGDSRDEKTGLPVYSLYTGRRRAPAPEQLAGLDTLVFDIQDIGCRFYTYISTLGNCLEAAARAGVRFVVLDRVNPVNGVTVEGPVLTGERSFVAWHEIPLRHGMTVGELARMFNAERGFGADLQVIRVEGWRRRDWLDATGLPWTNPSPNMRRLTAATLYPGVGVLEFCQLSVGRGTGTPFELLGAPYLNDRRLAAELNAAGLPGVRFLPVRYTPSASVFKGQECGGVQILLTDRATFRAADLAVTLAATLHRLHPDQLGLARMDRLLGHLPTRQAIEAGRSRSQVAAVRDAGLKEFRKRREKFLLYR
ncbi:MAG: exo-beta-N-acetylmuramidase NamZ domain-containing protein, partial [Verrucomicrobiota bacterium]